MYGSGETKSSANKKKYDGYDMSLGPDEDIDEDEEEYSTNKKTTNVNIQQYIYELAEKDPGPDPFEEKRVPTIADRERGKYTEKRQKLQLSPGVRYDPFAEGSQTPDIRSERRTTMAVMNEVNIMNEKMEVERMIKEKVKAGELPQADAQKKKRRWDQQVTATTVSEQWHEAVTPRNLDAHGNGASFKDMETPMNNVWDPTPGHAESGAVTPPDLASLSETPRVKAASAAGSRRRWDETPKTERANSSETPHASGWAETPKVERLVFYF